MGIVWQQDQLKAVVDVVTDVGGELAGALLALFVEPAPIEPTMVLADLTEATFTGYARSAAVVYGAEHINENGDAVKQVIPKEFKATGDAIQNTVTHVGLIDTTGLILLASYELPEPLAFTSIESVHMIGFPVTLSQPSDNLEEVIP